MALTRTNLHLFRVFPWDRNAAAGDRFSPQFIPSLQVSGRFDLSGKPLVLYLAESPEHAIAEKMQRYRGQELASADLFEFGHALAIVPVTIIIDDRYPVVDLCDPVELSRFEIRPDTLASATVVRTQSIARHMYEQKCAGFRWWSSLNGDWHSVIVFVDRVEKHGTLTYGTPVELSLNLPALVEAAARLSIVLARRK